MLASADTLSGTLDQRINAIEAQSHFFLAYQGENDRDLQSRYARLVRTLLGDSIPERRRATGPMGKERLRVAFAGTFFRDCTVGHYFKSWITDLDRSRFDVAVYLLGEREDKVTAEISESATTTLKPAGRIPDIARAIIEDAPDVLIYPELGMNGRTYALASLRLAPVQCVAWGHPVTSGHCAIDYYLSCSTMEPEGAGEHYTESLIRLPGLGTRYEKPMVAGERSREQLGLPDASRHLYLFPHAPYKVHPENDELLVQVLAADPDGIVIMLEGVDAVGNRILRNRLTKALDARGIADDRLTVLPHLSRAEFLEVNRACDLMLDTTRWSGGNTTLDALATGLPVVTRQGQFMRGRQSAGMLHLIGLPELVANGDSDYLDIALRLATDKTYRNQVSDRIVAGCDRLFNDGEPVSALASFLWSLNKGVIS